MQFERRGVMLVIASPSGAGKSSTTRALMANDANLTMSVSVTTRKMRAGEVDGADYQFLSIDQFEAMRERGELLEWAKVHSNFYGTPAARVDELIASGRDVVFDIDYQGTQQLYEKRRTDMVSVFLLPPSIGELQKRLRGRALDSEQVIAQRLKNARVEIEHWAEYDFVLVNDDLDETCAQVTQILATARISRTRQTNLSGFIKDLQAQIERL
ncbi:Guanylate kinase [hydrothermal vent metagenome]|uniref:guanylate kinase n=1 Tax=hydrothermal vent metagenome TaxID=652676 RepID=A0A3B0TD71_9ZZZZ